MKRILALVGVVILCLLYILTLIFALMKSPFSTTMFLICAVSTVAIPIIIQIGLTLNNVRRGKSILDNPYPYKDKKED